MNQIRNWIFAVILAAGVGGVASAVMVPQTALANTRCDSRLLTLPTWYRGLTDENCEIIYPTNTNDSGQNQNSSTEARQTLSDFIWKIALNVIEIMLHIVGYVAVGFIVFGGFVYLTSSGQPDKISGAKRSIMNAVIGLMISIFAIAIVNVVVGAF